MGFMNSLVPATDAWQRADIVRRPRSPTRNLSSWPSALPGQGISQRPSPSTCTPNAMTWHMPPSCHPSTSPRLTESTAAFG
eukprot:6447991-Prymnesium_polylepis.1